MTLLQSSYRECSLSVIQRGWLSLDWLCYFPSEITHEKVLELALVWLKKNEDTTLCSDPVIHLPFPIPVEILMSVFGQGGRSFWIFRLLPSPKWQTASSPGSAGLLVPWCYPSFPWASWLTSLSTWNISLHSPCCLLLPIYELQITFFWTREDPSFAHVCACSCPEFFTSLVYRRVDNTAFLCLRGSFMLWPSLFCLSQWRYWPDVGSGSVFTYFIFIFVSICVCCVCGYSLIYVMVCRGQRSTFWKEVLAFHLVPWGRASLADLVFVRYPPPSWSVNFWSTGDYRCTPVVPGFGLRSAD